MTRQIDSPQEVARQLLQQQFIPVLSFNAGDDELGLCQALYDQGLRVFEITLRSESAIEQLSVIIKNLPEDALVGAGTLMSLEDIKRVRDLGADFGVSPGMIQNLDRVVPDEWLYLPGVMTVSEAMAAESMGFRLQKFFPAEAAGGIPFMRSISSVLSGVKFCATGGISLNNTLDYLALSNVALVGGSWILRRDSAGNILIEESAAALAEVLALVSG